MAVSRATPQADRYYQQAKECQHNIFSREWRVWTGTIAATPQADRYGVATITRLLNIIGLFCKKAL